MLQGFLSGDALIGIVDEDLFEQIKELLIEVASRLYNILSPC